MVTNETLIPIPGRLHSVATEGHVAGADEIIDDTLQKDQATLNSESAYIDDSESSSAVVPSFDPESQTVHVTTQTLSEQQKAQVRENIGLGDVDAKINEAVASEASQRTAAVSGVQSSVNAETTRAQAAENTLNQKLSLLNGSEVIVVADHTQVSSPDSQKVYREQGESSYTDWMYQNNEWKEIATYNPGIDDEPTAGSDNLVKSGGVYETKYFAENVDDLLHKTPKLELGSIDSSDGSLVENMNTRARTKYFLTAPFYFWANSAFGFRLLKYNKDFTYDSYQDRTSASQNDLNITDESYYYKVVFWRYPSSLTPIDISELDDIIYFYKGGLLYSTNENVYELDIKSCNERIHLLRGAVSWTDGVPSYDTNKILKTSFIKGPVSVTMTSDYSFRNYTIYDSNYNYLRGGEGINAFRQEQISDNEYVIITVNNAGYTDITTIPKIEDVFKYIVPKNSAKGVEKKLEKAEYIDKEQQIYFELGSIDSSNGNCIDNTTGSRMRSSDYIIPLNKTVCVKTTIQSTATFVIYYKNGVYVGANECKPLSVGENMFDLSFDGDYNQIKISVWVSGATSYDTSNSYVYTFPVIGKWWNNVNEESFSMIEDIDDLTTSKIYAYYDKLVEKFPNYISKRVLGTDSSGHHEIREYVATLRDRYAYIYKERCYSWKNGNDVIYTESVSPRIGDDTYSDQLTTSTGNTVSASDCNNRTITVNSAVYNRDNADDIAADVIFRDNGSDATIVSDGKTYTRIANYDESSICKKKIVSICNEHGPGPNGDPREPSVVMYYLLKSLCEDTGDNTKLDWLKRYATLVIIPVACPFAYDEEGDAEQLGNLMGRVNANGVNINRNYPTLNWTYQASQPSGDYGASEIETQYNINCVMRHNPDIVIDEHCLGPSVGNYNIWHYSGSWSENTPAEIKMMMSATYNLHYIPYTSDAGNGDKWITDNNFDGCLIEMNQGYGDTLHHPIILRADRQIWLSVLEYYNVFSL